MPCNSDYGESTGASDSRDWEAGVFLIFVFKFLKKEIPEWVTELTLNRYNFEKRAIPLLCALLTDLKRTHQTNFDKLVYNAHNATSRKLADWWEAHQIEDAKRIRRERIKKNKEKIRQKALAKLSPLERKLLGL